MAIFIALIVSKITKAKDTGILMIELPEYKTPNPRTIRIYVWEKVKDYLTKAGTIIFLASIVLWFVLHTTIISDKTPTRTKKIEEKISIFRMT